MKENEKTYVAWEEVRKNLNLTEEEELAIQFELRIMEATVEARKKNKLTQRELSKRTGIKQSAIARIEKCVNSPKVSTLMKLLYPLRVYAESCSDRGSGDKKIENLY